MMHQQIVRIKSPILATPIEMEDIKYDYKRDPKKLKAASIAETGYEMTDNPMDIEGEKPDV